MQVIWTFVLIVSAAATPGPHAYKGVLQAKYDTTTTFYTVDKKSCEAMKQSMVKEANKTKADLEAHYMQDVKVTVKDCSPIKVKVEKK